MTYDICVNIYLLPNGNNTLDEQSQLNIFANLQKSSISMQKAEECSY